MEFVVVVIAVAIVGVLFAAVLPASRAMRADLVSRAFPGDGATQYAQQVANRPRLSWLSCVVACRRIDDLRNRDRENELLGQSAGHS